MIAHQDFSRLRLREFCPDDDLYSDDLSDDAMTFDEVIRGAWFARPFTRPDETFRVSVNLLDHSTDVGPSILRRLGLPFTRDTLSSEVIAMLGTPHRTSLPSPGVASPHSEILHFHMDHGGGYEIECVFLDPGVGDDWLPCYHVSTRSLWEVRVERSDYAAVMKEIEDRCP